MINNFIRIRQKLLLENKFSKYLIYATGEILIIVIGVLIAVQINNWNEERKIDKLEIQLLSEVENGLKNDLIDVIKNLSWHESIFDNQIILIKWLESDFDFNDSLLLPLSKSLKASSFVISDGPYETLKQFGLGRITNDSVKNKIIELYDMNYPLYNLIHEEYLGQLRTVLYQGSEYFYEYSVNPNDHVLKPINITQMKSDDKFLFHVKTLKNFNKDLLYHNNNMKSKLENTIQAIEKELQKRK